MGAHRGPGRSGRRPSIDTPVAVIGIGCRFPGAHGPTELWRLLCEGREAITDVPADRFDIDAFYDARPATPGKIVSRRGGFLERVDEFDAQFFGIAPREAVYLDPQHRLLLETAWEAIEDAGVADQLAATPTGVFVGQLTTNYWDILSRARALDIYANVGTARSVQSGRLSYLFDLRGPSVSLDTACSSSLVAVHLASQSLRSGESPVALAAGVNLILLPDESITFSQADMLSPDGRCKFAAASADGFVRSDGVGVLVLKPLPAALADGDDVYAVLHGSAVSNDGQTGGALMTPAEAGQIATLRAAYERCGVRPADVGYVEAHGTGTRVGDPVELRSLAAVFGEGRTPDRPLAVGSIKTNIGHTEAAAGVAGLIKAVLCVKHRKLPASLHSGHLTEGVDWGQLPIVVQRSAGDWPDPEHPALAGVSSFGISGTNAHVVVGEHRPAEEPASGEPEPARVRLLTISARTPAALRALAGSYVGYLGPDGAGRAATLRDIAFSAATRRRHHEARLTVVGSSHDEMIDGLQGYLAGEPGSRVNVAPDVVASRAKVIFAFPGQGSQWAGMGRELIRTQPCFLDTLQRCDQFVRAETGWSVIDRLDGDGADLRGIDVVQPTLWAMEIALAELWRSWGVEPDFVVGHSMGEVAAACVDGSLTLADGAAVICRRSRLLTRVAGRGSMAAVELGVEDAERELAGSDGLVSVAASNSPGVTVLSGEPQALQTILTRLEERGVFARLIKVDVASHSAQVDPLRADLGRELRPVTPCAGAGKLYSTVLGRLVDGTELTADYWVRNLREPVRFSDAIQALVDGGRALVVEISPHPILASSVQECLAAAGSDGLVVASLRRDEPDLGTMLDSVGAMYRFGHEVPLGKLYEPGCRYVRLPSYPWQRQRYWLETRAEPPDGAAPEGHPLLGVPTVASAESRVWEGPVDLGRNSYLLQHRVQDVPILPGTAYLELVTAAATQALGRPPVLRDVVYRKGVFLGEGEPAVLRVALSRLSDGRWGFEVGSWTGERSTWLANATGIVDQVPDVERAPDAGAGRAGEGRARILRRCVERATGHAFYERFARQGNQWRGAFQGIAELWSGDGEAIARVETPDVIADQAAYHHFHPALLDACGQVLAATRPDTGGTGDADAFVLERIERFRVHRRPGRRVWSHAARTSTGAAGPLQGDVLVTDDDGAPVAEIIGLRLAALDPAAGQRQPDGWLHEVRWRRAPTAVPDRAEAGRLVIFADRGGIATALAEAAGEGHVTVVAGDGYERLAPNRYQVDPTRADDYHRLLSEVHGNAPSEPIRVVHLWAVDVAAGAATDDSADPLGCLSVLYLCQALERQPTPRLWLVTRAGQYVDGTDRTVAPAQAAVWGMGRTIAAEHPEWRCALIDLAADAGAEAAATLRENLFPTDGETEIALRGGNRHVPRLAALPDRDPSPRAVTGGGRSLRLSQNEGGTLDELTFHEVPDRPVGPSEIKIETRYAALNFRDVLQATGTYPGQQGAAQIGWEHAGIVRAVGADVVGFAAGDEVVAVTAPGLGTSVYADPRLVFARPDRLSLREAVTVPIAFLTAYHALCDLARLNPGERVLIHTATGGVGLAAIQIARWMGAEVYATAGDDGKRALLRMMGVTHVADSRSGSFAATVRAATRGRGVDVVLNTLTGDLIERNLEVLAPYGRYVELSKRDLVDDGKLRLPSPLRNASLFVVDVADMVCNRPERAAAVLDKVFEAISAGTFAPLTHETYDVEDAPAAFRRMATARHVGKIVLSFDSARCTGGPPRQRTEPGGPRLSADATYLITGGAGGLGLVLARWLVEAGARHVLLVGRAPLPPRESWSSVAPDDPAAERIQAIRAIAGAGAGADVAYEAVDVADEVGMRAMLDRRHAAGHPPVRGVVHAAGVLHYRSVADLTGPELADMLRPKIGGALVLDKLFAHEPLDFFILFSSGSAVLGSPQLGGYAAANAGLDALAHRRRLAGLPALSINWGFWLDTGMVERMRRELGRDPIPKGVAGFRPAEGLAVLRRLMADDPVQALVLPVDWARWRRTYPSAAALPLLRDFGSSPRERETPVPDTPAPRPPELAPRPPAPVPRPPAPVPPTQVPRPEPAPAGSPPAGRSGPADRTTIEARLAEQVAGIMGLSAQRLNPRRPLNQQGLDSLMAAQVRREVQREFNVLLPIARMLGGATLGDLARQLSETVPPGE